MEGASWAMSDTPPEEAYAAVCETHEEAAARRSKDALMAKLNRSAQSEFDRVVPADNS